jgi:transaldolase
VSFLTEVLMNSLLELIQCGQSYWMDNLSRGMIQSGALKKRIVKQGLRGITSNPTIFNKAISKSADYDGQIRHLARAGAPVEDIYEQLVVKDVQNACDLLRPVFDESKGVDGFVSLEVSPYLAHDTERTMQETRRLFKAVDRPNVLIKIPGTTAGVLAIEEMLYEGVNINITLLFSVERYEEVAKAYLTALERRLAQGKPIDNVASVASFFLSRIDILVDQLLQHRMAQKNRPVQALIGKVAIANAKLAYQSFKKIFSSNRWKKLAAKGAHVQRPLWASTSTKNPQYSDVCYVEPLIGPHTVNTMPEETIAAFADHGRVKQNTVEGNVIEAAQTMAELERLGIDFRCVAWQLENEGVQKFIDPFAELMRTIGTKCQRLAS